MQRYNINNGVVSDCDNDGIIHNIAAPEITVDEHIKLHGGAIRFESNNDNRTYKWDLNDDFIADVNKMWEICCKSPGLWNSQINVLEFADILNEKDSEELCVSVSVSELIETMKREKVKYVSVNSLLRNLKQKHIINNYIFDDTQLTVTFKNIQTKKCLITAGVILELKVLISARLLNDKNGNLFYSDTLSGVYIDWDGDFHNIGDDNKDTENEIDVIIMKGLIPIFISCKNGRIDDDELYKLDTVASRFGGTYVKKVLISTYFSKKTDSMKYFRQRAKDMKINLIETFMN